MLIKIQNIANFEFGGKDKTQREFSAMGRRLEKAAFPIRRSVTHLSEQPKYSLTMWSKDQHPWYLPEIV